MRDIAVCSVAVASYCWRPIKYSYSICTRCTFGQLLTYLDHCTSFCGLNQCRVTKSPPLMPYCTTLTTADRFYDTIMSVTVINPLQIPQVCADDILAIRKQSAEWTDKHESFLLFIAYFDYGFVDLMPLFKMTDISYACQWFRIVLADQTSLMSVCLFVCVSVCLCLCVCVCVSVCLYVYRQSQVRKPTGSEVESADCLLIIGTGFRVQVFSLILDSSVSLSAGIQSAGE